MQHDSEPLYPTKMITTTKEDNLQMTPAVVAPSPPVQQINVQGLLLGPTNTVTVCPFCQASVNTSIKATVTTRTHILAVMCCAICCCCCIPYCTDSAKNIDHYCPNCHKFLGTYEK